MAAPISFGRRPSGPFAPDFVAGADPRLAAAHSFASGHQQSQPNFAHQPSDLPPNYQFTSGRTPFDHQIPFQAAGGSSLSSWFVDASTANTAQNLSEAGVPFSFDQFAQHASTHVAANLAGSSMPPSDPQQATVPSSAHFAATKSSSYSPPNAHSFTGISSSHIAPPSAAMAPQPLGPSVSPPTGPRRVSDESVHVPAAGPSGASIPVNGSAHSAESVGFHGSNSPNSSMRMSGSPEANNVSQSFPAFAPAATAPPGGMVMGAAVSTSVLDSIDSWLAPAPIAPSNGMSGRPASSTPLSNKRNISPSEPSASGNVSSSSRTSAHPTFHPGAAAANASTQSSVPFKTSMERRERNKASQRESRKRKQDRMETLESENAALRKALSDMKKFSHALSNGAGIRGQDGAEVAPIQLTKFTGAFHLDLIESHLDDESAEAEWNGMIGHRFPAPTSSAQEYEGGIPGLASSTSDSDEDNNEDANAKSGTAQVAAGVKSEGDASSPEKGKSSGEPSQSVSQQTRKAQWEILLNQKRHKAAQSFPSMVAVPELVLYRVCRLYFSTLLPFTTKLKSGIVNLRAAREVPSFIGGYEDLPRFPGDPSFGATELYLPKNLMPTEMQMRLGFHPVEIAVMPYPALRDRILTVLSAFQAVEEIVREEEDALRFSEGVEDVNSPPSGSEQASNQSNELLEEDIRRRTALVADMKAWKPKDFNGSVVMPDKSRIYAYGYHDKPRGSHRLRKPAQRWLDELFLEVVQTLRVWSPAGDVFDGECFEFKESFFRKYPYMVDGEMLRATNRWRRARGEDPIRL